jgi:hypothetical protein
MSAEIDLACLPSITFFVSFGCGAIGALAENA